MESLDENEVAEVADSTVVKWPPFQPDTVA
jgi:hypothetical protein